MPPPSVTPWGMLRIIEFVTKCVFYLFVYGLYDSSFVCHLLKSHPQGGTFVFFLLWSHGPGTWVVKRAG